MQVLIIEINHNEKSNMEIQSILNSFLFSAIFSLLVIIY